MKATSTFSFISILILALLTACGGGGGNSNNNDGKTPPPIPLKAKHLLSGKVVDSDTLKALGNAVISAKGSQTIADNDGNYSFEIETDEEAVLINASAAGFSENQKSVRLNTSESSSVYSNISLKANSIEDVLLLVGIASSGKKSNKKLAQNGTNVAVTKVIVDPSIESNLIPSAGKTDELNVSVDYLSVAAIGLVNSETEQKIITAPSDFVYRLTFQFISNDDSLDIAGLALWSFDSSLGVWSQHSNKLPILSNITNHMVTLVYEVSAQGWYAVGQKIIKLANLKGRVVDQNGSPVAKALVRVNGVSYNGETETRTDGKGIFELKVKAGSTVIVSVEKLGLVVAEQTLTLQNYSYNEGGVVDKIYSQPAGPSNLDDDFYTKYPDFSDLIPPAGFSSVLPSTAAPLTLVVPSHSIKGSILYATESGNQPVPLMDGLGNLSKVSILPFGSFALTDKGELATSLPILSNTELSASASFSHEGKTYIGHAKIRINTDEEITNFDLVLQNTSIIVIEGVVSRNGASISNSLVLLSTGLSQLTDSTGKYRFQVPSIQLPIGTTIYASYKNLSTNETSYSASHTISADKNQQINLELLSFKATITGRVLNQVGEPIARAKISALSNDQTLGVNVLTDPKGNYSFMVPLKPGSPFRVHITGSYLLSGLNERVTGSALLNFTAGDDVSILPNFNASDIILDLSAADTKIKGRISMNGALQAGATLMLQGNKVTTSENGYFEVPSRVGQNKLRAYMGNEAMKFGSAKADSYEYVAVKGVTTDLGTIACDLDRPFVRISLAQFQKEKDILPKAAIQNVLKGTQEFVYLLILAEGSNQMPSIQLSDNEGVLVLESIDELKHYYSALYEIPISDIGKYSYSFVASIDSAVAIGSKTLNVLEANRAPLITAFRLPDTLIDRNDTEGVALSIQAMDPDGDVLNYQWELLSPTDDSVILENANTHDVLIKTQDTTASKIILKAIVSDGKLETEKSFVLALKPPALKLSSFALNPTTVAAKGVAVKVNFETDPSKEPTSISLDWGDGSVKIEKKAKAYSYEHRYTKEGFYAISLVLTDENGLKTVFSKIIQISDTYKMPSLKLGTITFDEDTTGEIDLNSLLQNQSNDFVYTYSISKKAANGLASLNGNILTYKPNNNFYGNDQVLVKVSDGISFSEATSIQIVVTGVNDTPVLADISLQAMPFITLTKDLKAILTDPDVSDVHTFKIEQAPQIGTASIDGSNLVFYATTSGSTSLKVSANDGKAKSNHATIIIKVNQPTDDIQIADQNYTIEQDTEFLIDLATLLRNPLNLGPIDYLITNDPSKGTAKITGTKLSYKPNAGYFGTDSLQLIARIVNNSPSKISNFRFTINKTKVTPTLKDKSYTVRLDQSLNINLNDIVVTKDTESTLTFVVKTNPTKGNYTLTGSTLVYNPTAQNSTTDSIIVTAKDGEIVSNQSTITLNLLIPNAPAITNDSLGSGRAFANYYFKVIGTHPQNLSLTYDIKDAPSWIQIDKNTGELTNKSGQWPTGEFSSETITVTLTDGFTVVEEDFSITIDKALITSNNNDSLVAIIGQEYQYQIKIGDAPTMPSDFTFSIVNGKTGMSIDNQTGLFTWTANINDAGKHIFSIEYSYKNSAIPFPQTLVIYVGYTYPPKIVSFVASDALSGGAPGYSNGDFMAITFDKATNTPNVANKSQVDNLLLFSHAIGNNYSGNWVNPRTLVITVIDKGIANPLVGELFVLIKETGALLDSTENSPVSLSMSNPITGSWSVVHDMPDFLNVNLDDAYSFEEYSVQIDVTNPQGGNLTFSLEEPPVWAQINPTTGLITSQPNQWPNYYGSPTETLKVVCSDGVNIAYKEFVINVYQPRVKNSIDTRSQYAIVGQEFQHQFKIGDTATAPYGFTFSLDNELQSMTISGTSGLFVWTPDSYEQGKNTFDVKISYLGSPVISKTETLLTGTNPPPKIVAFIASDAENNGLAGFSDGDFLRIVFDVNVSSIQLNNKADIDNLLEFSHSIGDDYIATWRDNKTLDITITNIGSANPPLNALTVEVLETGVLKSISGAEPISLSKSGIVTGDWSTFVPY